MLSALRRVVRRPHLDVHASLSADLGVPPREVPLTRYRSALSPFDTQGARL